MAYNSFDSLNTHVKEKLKKNNFDDALHLVKDFVEKIILNNFLNGLLIDIPGLDDLCLEVGEKVLPSIEQPSNQQHNELLPILYIASQFYMCGGHTAVVIDFIRAQINKKHIVLLTDIFNTGEQQEIKDRFSGLPVELIFAPYNAAYHDKLLWLHKQWRKINPQKVFLFNHQQDPIVIAAAQSNMPGELFFYHHADFTLSLGTRLKHAKHIDMNPLLFSYCKNSLGINNVYCPLTYSESSQNKNNKNHDFMSGGTINTATSTNFAKISTPYLFSYFDLIPEIIKITKGHHLHIGFLPETTLELVKEKLVAAKIPINQFIYLPWTNSVAATIIEHDTDLYINSFPIGGGRTEIEIMASGTPILCHLNYRSIFLSTQYYLYPEAFMWDRPDSLKKIIRQLTPQLLAQHSLLARNFYEKNYTQEILTASIENDFKDTMPPKNIEIGDIIPDPTQLFLDLNYETTQLHDKTKQRFSVRTILKKLLKPYNYLSKIKRNILW